MNVGYYQSAAAMSGLEQWQQSIAQNLAAGSVPGYKKTQSAFESFMGPQRMDPSGQMMPVAMPERMNATDMTEGALRRTDVPTDVAIQGEGFFKLRTPDGQTLYTRDGEFKIGPNQTLVSKQGFEVQGQGGPIAITPGNGELRIEDDGRIVQGLTPIGNLDIVEFEDMSVLMPVGGGFLSSNDGLAQPVAEARVVQGHLEGSNVSMIYEMVNMIQVSHAHEANQKAIQSYDERLGRAIQVLGGN